MTFRLPFRSALAVMALSLGLGLTPIARAVRPAVPTDIKVDFTRAAVSDASGDYTSYRFTWKDKAFDEAGYGIQARVGSAGEFRVVQQLPANSESGVVTLHTKGMKDAVLQFLVTPYKLNGANLEYSYAAVTSVTVTEGTGSMEAPTGLQAAMVGDGTVKLTWTDASTNEMFFQLLYKKEADTDFSHLGYVSFNNTEASLQLGLKPGQAYQFAIRATREAPANGVFAADSKHVTAASNVASLTVPSLLAPTELDAEANGETLVSLSWKDNSTNETGYKIEQRTGSTGDFTTLGTVAANTTTISVPSLPLTATEWRVRAVYQTTDMTTAIESDPTEIATVNTLFPGPTELVATSSAHAGAVELTWKDNSNSESVFDIHVRKLGSGADFQLALTVPANTAKATVSYLDTAGSTALTLNETYEFKVRGRYLSSPEIVSGFSETASAQARPGITSRFYHPITTGVSFSYQMTTSAGRTQWAITGLPPGLSFSSGTGGITGTTNQSGIYVCPMKATFSDGWVAEGTLTLRVRRNPAAPNTAKIISSTSIAPKTVLKIPLTDKFADPDSEKAVRLNTTLGDIDILLYPSLTPKAVENFMAYVSSGAYDGVTFHRSASSIIEGVKIPFVLQGGAFRAVASPKSFQSVTALPSPVNEPGISNVRGTIAAAKVANNPDSATHDFFVNLNDNNNETNPDSLDNQNGGFTVFGRVAGTGMAGAVNDIADLPTGDYVDYNDYSVAEPVYDASLDKRVLVDGSPANFQDFPMNTIGSAPSDMNVLQAVRILTAREISPLTYAVAGNSDSTVVAAEISGSDVVLTGLKVGVSTVSVKVTDLDNNTITQSFDVTVKAGYKGPAITTQPVSVAVANGGKATFRVGATGTALSYQWRKDGVAIPDATSASLVLSNVSNANVGSYDVLVSNETAILTSNAARLDIKAIADVTSNPVSRLLKVGDPLELAITATGAPVPAISWTRDGRAVAKQNKVMLSVPAVKLSDAGVYKATASNSVGKDVSATASVCVVDKASSVQTVKPGAKVVLKAPVAGPFTAYQWLKDDVEISDGTRIAGAQTAVLTLSGALEEDTAVYTCRATAPDGLGSSVSGDMKLVIVMHAPVLADFTAPVGVVGFNYEFTIPWDPADSNNTPNFFNVPSSLPAGLTFDTKTGKFSGRPRVAGTYKINTSVRNAFGNSNAAVGTFVILPLPQVSVGTFVAGVQASELNGNKGGRVDLSILDLGTYTGRLTLGASVYRFAGVITYLPGALAPQSSIIIPRTGKSPVQLTFGIDPSTGKVSGQVTDGSVVSTVTGIRQFWNSIWNPSYFFAGTYGAGLNLDSAYVDTASVPQGSGYATMTVTLSGTVSIAGKLADGTGITGGSIVGPFGDFLLYQMLYKNTGSVLGFCSLGVSNLETPPKKFLRVDGGITWVKDAQKLASERNYKAGFGPVTMTALGGTTTLTNSAQIMGLPLVPSNLQLDFSKGGLELSGLNPDILVTMLGTNTPGYPTDNPGKVKLSISSNGLYTGSFELYDPTAPKRPVSFAGFIVPRIPGVPASAATSTSAAVAEVLPVDASANGFFLLPQLPSAGPPATTLKTSPILSGKVVLKPIGITISTQPVSQEVDVGANVTFTVAATGQGALTYRWRKNQVAIEGATQTSYSITGVTEASEGSYDVIVSNGAVTQISSPAGLDVRDAVSGVAISRSPSHATVATGSPVVFTATVAKGATPLSYQWRKDGVDIPGETSVKYTISQVAAEHVGTYSVRVSNSVTPAGELSNDSALAVADGVTNIVITKTPSAEQVMVGETVVFSVTAEGQLPMTFQWRKNGQNIAGATSDTYTLQNVGIADSANYDVVITNVATPSGATGAQVGLTVTDGSSFTATRSPSNEFVAENQAVTFSVVAPTSPDPWSYQWRKNGIDIPDATSSSYQVTVTMADDDASWDVVITNASNPSGLTSNAVPVRVQTPVSDVNVIQDPVNPVTVGSQVTFSVTAAGSGPFFYQWRRGSANISGATSSTYIIPQAAEGDSDTYDVIVSNNVSTATGPSLVLTVTP